jgi:hypothetical protein
MIELRGRSRFCVTRMSLAERRAERASLIECPPLGPGNYVLVRRDAEGRATWLGSGRLVSQAPSLNLALIRRRGAELGANEVQWFESTAS